VVNWDSRGSGCGNTGVAVNYAGGSNWLDDSAGAVGDGQGGALGSSVGDAVEGQLSCSWADGGIGSVNLGGVDNAGVGVGSGGGGGHEGCEGDNGELHLDGWLIDWYYLRVVIRVLVIERERLKSEDSRIESVVGLLNECE